MDRGRAAIAARSFYRRSCHACDGLALLAIVLSNDAGLQPGVSPPSTGGSAADSRGVADAGGRVSYGVNYFSLSGDGSERISRKIPHSWGKSFWQRERRAEAKPIAKSHGDARNTGRGN